MATNHETEQEDQSSFFKDFNIRAKVVISHPRFRDTFVPSAGVAGVALGINGNPAIALGIALLAFALLDKRK